jgi:hypothetical protein
MKHIMTTLSFISVCLAVFPGNLASRATFDKSLVLYLPFDEGKGDVVLDISNSHSVGVIHNAKWVKGKSGSALEFSGDGYVEVKGGPKRKAEGITCMAWIFSDVMEPGNIIISRYSEDNKRGYELSVGESSALQFKVFAKGEDLPDECLEIAVARNVLERSKWIHVAATFKGKEFIRIYVNGTLKAEGKTHIPCLFDNTEPLRIGVGFSKPRTPFFFKGVIDEVAVYHRALSGGEIQQMIKQMAVSSYGKLPTTWGHVKEGDESEWRTNRP